jgi:xylan 1,4-beta-xylosidase
VLVWNYHDDDLPAPASPVVLTIGGLPDGSPTLTHFRIDQDHSNSYALWQEMGSPQPPTAEQHARLEAAGRLQMLGAPGTVVVSGGRAVLRFELPRQGVSLVELKW